MSKEIPPKAKTRVLPTTELWDKQSPLVMCLGSLDELLVAVGVAAESLKNSVVIRSVTEQERKWLFQVQRQILMTKVAVQGAAADEEYVEYNEHLVENLEAFIEQYSKHFLHKPDDWFVPSGGAIEVFRAWVLCRAAERSFWAQWTYFTRSRGSQVSDLPGRYLDKLADALRALGLNIAWSRSDVHNQLPVWRPQMIVKPRPPVGLSLSDTKLSKRKMRSGAVKMYSDSTKGVCPECQAQASPEDVVMDFTNTEPMPYDEEESGGTIKLNRRNITYKCPHCGHGWGDQYFVDEDGMPSELKSESS